MDIFLKSDKARGPLTFSQLVAICDNGTNAGEAHEFEVFDYNPNGTLREHYFPVRNYYKIKKNLRNVIDANFRMKSGEFHHYSDFITDVEFTTSPACSTACTDGYRLWMNPEFAERLVDKGGRDFANAVEAAKVNGKIERSKKVELSLKVEYRLVLFVLLHECFHKFYRHNEAALRKLGRNMTRADHYRCNIAMDMQINRDIERWYKTLKGATEEADGQMDPKPKLLRTWGDIYDDMVNAEKNKKKNPPQPQEKKEPEHKNASESYRLGREAMAAAIEAGFDIETYQPFPVDANNLTDDCPKFQFLLEAMSQPMNGVVVPPGVTNIDEFYQACNDLVAEMLKRRMPQPPGMGSQEPEVEYDNLREAPYDPKAIPPEDGSSSSSKKKNQQQDQQNQNGQGGESDDSDDSDNQNDQQNGQGKGKGKSSKNQQGDDFDDGDFDGDGDDSQSGKDSKKNKSGKSGKSGNQSEDGDDADGDDQDSSSSGKSGKNQKDKNGKQSGQGGDDQDVDGSDGDDQNGQGGKSGKDKRDNQQDGQGSGSDGDGEDQDGSRDGQSGQSGKSGNQDKQNGQSQNGQDGEGLDGQDGSQNSQNSQQQSSSSSSNGSDGGDTGTDMDQSDAGNSAQSGSTDINKGLGDGSVKDRLSRQKNASMQNNSERGDLISREESRSIAQYEGLDFPEIDEKAERERIKKAIEKNKDAIISSLDSESAGELRATLDAIAAELEDESIVAWDEILYEIFTDAGIAPKKERKYHMRRIASRDPRAYKKSKSEWEEARERNAADIFYLIDSSGSMTSQLGMHGRIFTEILEIEQMPGLNIKKSALTFFADDIKVDRIRTWLKEDDIDDKLALMLSYEPGKDVGGGTAIAKSVRHVIALEDMGYDEYYTSSHPKTVMIVYTDGEEWGSRWDSLKSLDTDILEELIFIIVNDAKGLQEVIAQLLAVGILPEHIVPINNADY